MIRRLPVEKMGESNLGWLRSKFHFSFAEYFNEEIAERYEYKKDGDKWRPVGGEAEPDFYWIVENAETFKWYNTYKPIDPETGEWTGNVYTEIITYKKIQ